MRKGLFETVYGFPGCKMICVGLFYVGYRSYFIPVILFFSIITRNERQIKYNDRKKTGQVQETGKLFCK